MQKQQRSVSRGPERPLLEGRRSQHHQILQKSSGVSAGFLVNGHNNAGIGLRESVEGWMGNGDSILGLILNRFSWLEGK